MSPLIRTEMNTNIKKLLTVYLIHILLVGTYFALANDSNISITNKVVENVDMGCMKWETESSTTGHAASDTDLSILTTRGVGR